MKTVVVLLLLAALTANAQQPQIIAFDPATSLTFVVESPPINAGLQYCLDLVNWDWHTFPADSVKECTTETNAYDFTAMDWQAFRPLGSSIFLRIVCSSNDIATTVTTNRLTFVNQSTSVVSNIEIGLVQSFFGDHEQVTTVSNLLPEASSGEFDFLSDDPDGSMSGVSAFSGTYVQGSTEKRIWFTWFCWGPSLAEGTVQLDNTGYTVKYETFTIP